jgi:hypothetical protein
MKKYFSTIQFLYKFIPIIIGIYATLNFVNERTFITILIIWLVYALYCLGLMNKKQIEFVKTIKNLRNVQ